MRFFTNPLLLLSLFIAHALAGRKQVLRLSPTCITNLPSHPFNGSSCGTPLSVDLDTFGNNDRSTGVMRMTQIANKLRVRIKLRNLPRPDLVLTAWILYALPGPDTDPIFDIANIDAPLAATTAGFTTGLGREPNQFRYTTRTTAQLFTKLDFNPTLPKEGALTGRAFCFQKDIPGIQETRFRQPPVMDDIFTPTTNYFLRRYERTGFEKLNEKGRPVLVRSPVSAIGVIVAVHIDKTTHGVTAGNFPVDNYELFSFRFDGGFGKPIVTH